MAARDLNEKTRISLPLAIGIGILLSTAGAVKGAFVLRDDAIADIRHEQADAITGIRKEQDAIFNRYVSREEFLQWQLAESQKRDRQFNDIMLKLAELASQMSSLEPPEEPPPPPKKKRKRR